MLRLRKGIDLKQRFKLDTNAVRVLLERQRRSPQLDQWFAENRCSVSAIVAAEFRFGLECTLISDDQVFAQLPGLHCVQVS